MTLIIQVKRINSTDYSSDWDFVSTSSGGKDHMLGEKLK
jgi:hypothetical protein